MDIKQIVPLLYYLSKSGMKELHLDSDSLPEEYKSKIGKLSRSASHQLMIAYLKEQIED
jgi:hypothetical protein